MSARLRRHTAVAGLGVSALLLAACGGGGGNDTAGGEGRLDQLRDDGTITVGFAGEAPYSFMGDDGELAGASVALQEKIWGELGIENVEGVQAEFGQLIQGLNAGRFDIVAAGMSILPERCDQALFSDPEFQYTTALMVPAGNPNDLSDMQSIAESGVTMAAMTGAIESDYASSLDISPLQVGNPQDGMDAVTNGRADVFALTGISLNWMAENAGNDSIEVTESFVAVIDDVEQVGAGGTVFRQDDTELRDAYNEKLAEVTADDDAYLDVVGDWGFTAAERPAGDLTTEQLCSGELG